MRKLHPDQQQTACRLLADANTEEASACATMPTDELERYLALFAPGWEPEPAREELARRRALEMGAGC